MCYSTNHEYTRAGILCTPTKQRNERDHAKRSLKRFTQSTKKKNKRYSEKSYQPKPATLRLQKITQRYQILTLFPPRQNIQLGKKETPNIKNSIYHLQHHLRKA